MVILAHVNDRLVIAHFLDVRNLILNPKYDSVGVMETEFNAYIPNNILCIDGYKFELHDRQDREGGVAVYIRDPFNYTLIQSGINSEQI